MKTIYIDPEFKCHVVNDGTMTAVETSFFDGKCDAFVEGYCYKVDGNSTAIYPWKPYGELDKVQRKYERQLIAEYEAELAELDAALLEVQYQNLIAESE